MPYAAAFRGVLTSIRPLKTSGDVQFIFTVPRAEADAALFAAGGFVDPAESRWFGIARMNAEADVETAPPVNHETDNDGVVVASAGNEAERDASAFDKRKAAENAVNLIRAG